MIERLAKKLIRTCCRKYDVQFDVTPNGDLNVHADYATKCEIAAEIENYFLCNRGEVDVQGSERER